MTPEEYEKYLAAKEIQMNNLKGHMFEKGHAPVSNGRPKIPDEAKRLMKDTSYQAAVELCKIALNGSNKKQIEAIKELFDRVWGKATQPLDVESEDTIKVTFGNDDYAR